MKQFTDQPIGCRTKVAQMWGKRRDMTVRDRSPFNAEPPASVLADAEITALDAFYSRNHGPFPDIARDQWRLAVDGLIDTPLTLTYDQLITGFTPVSVVATLACAGNRRAELLNVRPIPGKDPWAHGRSRPPNGVERGWQMFSRPPGCTMMTVCTWRSAPPMWRRRPFPFRRTAAQSRCPRPCRGKCCWPGR
jgi:DMSO/TMAO reductase YedYZ molybdopterin-dependent catalytic subunit